MSKIIKLEKTSCPSCERVSLFLDSQNISYETIDVMKHPEVGGIYGVMSVPVTILLDDNGKEVQRSIGYKQDELEEIVSKLN